MTATTYAQALRDCDRLVTYIARRHVAPGVELDDLVQEGRLALLSAADRWRPDGGSSFASFAARSILNFLRISRRGDRRRGLTVGAGARRLAALHFDGPDAEGNDPDPGTDATQETELATAEALHLLRGARASLTAREREVLTMRFDDELTWVDAGAALGVSPSRIGQIQELAVERMRKRMRAA